MSLSKEQILSKWYREGLVQKNVKHYKNANWEEVVAMVYADLCEKDEELLQHLEETGEKKFYISRMVSNQIISKESPYRRQNRFSGLISPIDTYLDTFKNKSAPEALKTLEERLTGEDLIILDMILNSPYNRSNKMHPIAELMEYYGISSHHARKKYNSWVNKVKKILKKFVY